MQLDAKSIFIIIQLIKGSQNGQPAVKKGQDFMNTQYEFDRIEEVAGN